MNTKYKRIVVKVGSNVLTRPDGTLDVTRMSAIVDQVASLRRSGVEVILVSSGAVASGRSEMRGMSQRKLDTVGQRQLYSAVGQAKLINRYYELFREHGITVGQVLTMRECFSTRSLYLNQRHCMTVLLENGVLPIVNENDTVSVTELMFTDNDELSGLVATMMDAQALVILSNVDGVYNGVPGNEGVEVIRYVEHGKDLADYIQATKSSFGRGGMITKCGVARKVAGEGIAVYIANGKRDNILVSLAVAPADVVCTCFVPNKTVTSGIKSWLAHSAGFAQGTIVLNDDAVKVVCGDKAASVLPVGVISYTGNFERGDLVEVADTAGKVLGVGRVAYDSNEINDVIGKPHCAPVIHYNYLYLE